MAPRGRRRAGEGTRLLGRARRPALHSRRRGLHAGGSHFLDRRRPGARRRVGMTRWVSITEYEATDGQAGLIAGLFRQALAVLRLKGETRTVRADFLEHYTGKPLLALHKEPFADVK